MKNLLYFLLFSISFLACSNNKTLLALNREKAIEKHDEAVNIYLDAVFGNFNTDSLLMAMNLIDESIALDSTYMLAYQTKARFLKGQNQYKEALEVINLAFHHHLEKDNPILFLNRAILYENLNLIELAKNDYNAALLHYDQWIKKHPNDYNALNMRAMVIFLYKGKEAGIQTYEKLLDKPLNDIEREEIKIFMREIKNKSRKEIINSIN